MMYGKIKVVNSKGYGFISDDKGIDWFFHYSQYQGDWKQLVAAFVNGKKWDVSFDNDPNASDGPRALSVKLVIPAGEKK